MTTKMEAAAAMSGGGGADGGWKTSWGLESRPSDACGSSLSALSCRPDSAFLCGPCDARSHSRHARVRLCEVCERSPAAVTCKADAADLCAACDADIHSANPLARRHERVPLVPILDSSSGDDAGGLYGRNHHRYHFKDAVAVEDCFFGRYGEDVDVDDLKGADCFFSDALDPYLDLVEYADSVVPVQQETKFCHDGGVVAVTGAMPVQERPAVDFDFGRCHGSAASYSVCSSEAGVVPDAVGDASKGCTNGAPGIAQASSTATAVDREARVMRYREKRKNRRFEKTVRYASRKAYAETRPRIKGRFVKRAEVEADGMPVTDGGYGVVPSF